MIERKKHSTKSRILSGLVAAILLIAVVVASLPNAILATETSAPTAEGPEAKYLFLFIGDGMSYAQVHSAQVFKGNNAVDEIDLDSVNFSEFSTKGIANTHDATSFCPDSASTATSISSGFKTHSGVIGLGIDRSVVGTSIAKYAKAAGRKVGIVSSVTLNHATPAAFMQTLNRATSTMRSATRWPLLILIILPADRSDIALVKRMIRLTSMR